MTAFWIPVDGQWWQPIPRHPLFFRMPPDVLTDSGYTTRWDIFATSSGQLRTRCHSPLPPGFELSSTPPTDLIPIVPPDLRERYLP